MALGKRIAEALDGREQKYLSDAIPGLSQQSLSNLISRDSATSEYAVRIADRLGVSVRWLLDGIGRKDDSDWPFRRVDISRWHGCDDEDRGYVQAAINKALDDCEASRRGKGASDPFEKAA